MSESIPAPRSRGLRRPGGAPGEGGAATDGAFALVDTWPLPSGWRVIGAREFTEHILSVRFVALLLVLGMAGALAIYAVSGSLRDAASQIPRTPTGQIPVFPLLFTISPSIAGISGQQFPSFAGMVALLGPVLGIAFGFDAISSERSEGTLPRARLAAYLPRRRHQRQVRGRPLGHRHDPGPRRPCCSPVSASSAWASCPTGASPCG